MEVMACYCGMVHAENVVSRKVCLTLQNVPEVDHNARIRMVMYLTFPLNDCKSVS
jgi:hypothetical protein